MLSRRGPTQLGDNVAVVPESPLPAADPTVVITDRTKPQNVKGVRIEKQGQHRIARTPTRPAPASQRGRFIAVARLSDNLGPILGEPQSPRGIGSNRAVIGQ